MPNCDDCRGTSANELLSMQSVSQGTDRLGGSFVLDVCTLDSPLPGAFAIANGSSSVQSNEGVGERVSEGDLISLLGKTYSIVGSNSSTAYLNESYVGPNVAEFAAYVCNTSSTTAIAHDATAGQLESALEASGHLLHDVSLSS